MKDFYTAKVGTRDGRKGIELSQYPDDAWTYYSEPPKKDMEDLFTSVAGVFRAMNINADAVANLPFEVRKIGDDGEDEPLDSSSKWENYVGYMPRPKELLRRWRMSLGATNSAYGFMENTRVGRKRVKELRYILPDSVQPLGLKDGDIEKIAEQTMVDSLWGFERNEQMYNIKNDGTCTIFYSWRLDHTTELLPSKNTELRAMAAAAGILYWSDYLLKDYFQRGGLDPHMLMLKGVADKDTREKVEKMWDRFVRGVERRLGKVFNAEAIEAVPIGKIMDNFQDNNLYEERMSDIAMASGIPLSLLLANSANYATAETEYESWYRDRVYPDAQFLAQDMNEKLFNPAGLQFEFVVEETDMATEEESERAEAFAWYVNAGMAPSIAVQILGIDLPDGVNPKDLDPDEEELSSTDQESEGIPSQPDDLQEEPNMRSFSIDELEELRVWRRAAVKRYDRGDSLDFEYNPHHGGLPDDVAQDIKNQLADATTDIGRERLKSIFNAARWMGEEKEIDNSEIKILADALNNAADKLSVQPNIVNVHLPQNDQHEN